MDSESPLPSRLYQRLTEALQQGIELEVSTQTALFLGVPIYLDAECVELVDLFVADDVKASDDSPCQRTVWLIKLSAIIAIAYPTESWSTDDLEKLLHPLSLSPTVPDV